MAIDAIARNKAEALIREQLVNTIQQDVPKSSTVMQLGTRLANMTSNQTKIPVLSMLPLAYWVNGDTGMKKTSKQEWDNVYMTAAELAVIVPVPEAVLADSSFDIMGEVQPRVREAMGSKNRQRHPVRRRAPHRVDDRCSDPCGQEQSHRPHRLRKAAGQGRSVLQG